MGIVLESPSFISVREIEALHERSNGPMNSHYTPIHACYSPTPCGDCCRPVWRNIMTDHGTEHRFDFTEDELPSRALLHAVARVRDADPMDLTPLREHISTDAVDTLVRSCNVVVITFFYEGLEVTIRGEGTLILYDLE